MVVHFYEIPGCTCENVDNRPVLVAPERTQPELLHYYQFVRLDDGRWVHFLSKEEYAYVMRGYPYNDVTFSLPLDPVQEEPKDPARGNLLGGIGLGLFVLGLLLPFCATTVLKTTSTDLQSFDVLYRILELIGGGSAIASFVVMLVTRIRYPKNILGKVLMWLFIVEGILAVLAAILLVIACVACLQQCASCTNSGC